MHGEIICKVVADDVARRVNAPCARGQRSREVDGGELTPEKEESMDAVRVLIVTDDLTTRVNARCNGAERARETDRRKVATPQQKAMDAARSRVAPHDVPPGVDPQRPRVGSAGDVNRGEHTAAQQVPVPRSSANAVVADDVPRGVDSERLRHGCPREIHARKAFPAEQEAMHGPVRGQVNPDDFVLIDPEHSGFKGPRVVDRGSPPARQDVAMTVRIPIVAGNIPSGVDGGGGVFRAEGQAYGPVHAGAWRIGDRDAGHDSERNQRK